MTARITNAIRKANRVARALKIIKRAALRTTTDPAERQTIQSADVFAEAATGDFLLGHRATKWMMNVPAHLVREEARCS